MAASVVGINSGIAANLSGAVTNPAGLLQIDTTTPGVPTVISPGGHRHRDCGRRRRSSGRRRGNADGQSRTLAVICSGTPTLVLNDGGTATYSGGSVLAELTFKYTVICRTEQSPIMVTSVVLNRRDRRGAG